MKQFKVISAKLKNLILLSMVVMSVTQTSAHANCRQLKAQCMEADVAAHQQQVYLQSLEDQNVHWWTIPFAGIGTAMLVYNQEVLEDLQNSASQCWQNYHTACDQH